jgi:hypothetical protein
VETVCGWVESCRRHLDLVLVDLGGRHAPPLVSSVPMGHVHSQPGTGEGIVERGHALYERDILPGLDPGTRGKFLAVDVDTGDYEVDSDELAALKRLRDRRPEARLYLLRVGFPVAYRIGAEAKAPALPWRQRLIDQVDAVREMVMSGEPASGRPSANRPRPRKSGEVSGYRRGPRSDAESVS